MKKLAHRKILISGASFAGLCTAYWMNRLGYRVTVVELSHDLKRGGTPVNILENTISIVKRMGLLEQIKAQQISMQSVAFKNADDVTQYCSLTPKRYDEQGAEEYEIERDILLDMLYTLVKNEVTFMFDDSITSLTAAENGVQVGFKNSTSQIFDLVFGCDGIHSVVRKLWFGPEQEFVKFLQTYFSITIINKLLIPEFTMQMYSEPGQTVMLNAYNGKTDICLAYHADHEVPYDYRNEQQQRTLIAKQFKDTGWRTPELLQEVQRSSAFYFDKLCQVIMPSWTKGRVALVGDAGYCASPAAGRGGSLAIDGAAALAAAFEKHENDHALAFEEYNVSFRPFIEQLQADVVNYSLNTLVPKTEEAIRKRNTQGFGF